MKLSLKSILYLKTSNCTYNNRNKISYSLEEIELFKKIEIYNTSAYGNFIKFKKDCSIFKGID